MTTNKVITITVATYFCLQFVCWLLGWMIWPIIWIGLGVLSIKVWNWTNSKEYIMNHQLDFSEKVVCLILGPLMGLIAFAIDGHRHMPFFKSFSIRNPFVWKTNDKDVDDSK